MMISSGCRKYFLPLIFFLLLPIFANNEIRLSINPNIDSNLPEKANEANVSRPVVIWFHNVPTFSLASLDTATKSGVVDYVLLLHLHPLDAPLPDEKADRAIEICRKNNVPFIWCRTLWPTYKNADLLQEKDLYQPENYINILNRIKFEASVLGTAYSAVDTEVYGNNPLRRYYKQKLPGELYEKISAAIQKTMEQTAPVDYVLPSMGYYEMHIYDILANLGRLKIAEHTYYDIPSKLADNRLPHDVFGAFLSITKKNKKHPKAQFFTVEEVFERSSLWKDKHGIMLFTSPKLALDISKEINNNKIRKLKSSLVNSA
ncbi:MAG: hypothetical protein ACYSSI_02770, partial [Planctomycetota bacterium]